MSNPVFEVENLSLHYLTRFGQKIHAVTDVSFEMKQGEILGIAGESGCGKSTLVNGLMGLFIPPLYPSAGDVRVAGESLMNRTEEEVRKNVLSRKVSMIPQGAFNALNPTRKVKDIAADVITAHEAGADRASTYARLAERFSLFFGKDAERVLNAFPIQLTAGERQRSVIGISTLLNPQMVIADEPTSALDVSVRNEVLRILDHLVRERGMGLIFISHDLNLVAEFCDRVLIMYAGRVVEELPAHDLKNARHPYTQGLLNSLPRLDHPVERLSVLQRQDSWRDEEIATPFPGGL